MKYFAGLLFLFVLFFASCKKDDKPEFLDEKAPSIEETKKQPEKKKDDGKDTSIKKDFKDESKPEAECSPLEAKEYIGKVVTVKGFVADVFKSEKVAYLNFMEKYPNNPFTAVIFASKFEDFGDLNKFENQNVEVTGRVGLYKDKPQIILNSERQIKIVN